MRKIRKDEIRKVSAEFAEMFKHYDAYKLFFDDSSLKKGTEVFFNCEVYGCFDFTYTNDDMSVIASIKRPGDRERALTKLFLNPSFFVRFMSVTDKKARRLVREYVDMAENTAKKYYDPSTDCYIKNIGVAERARGKGLLRKTLEELCKDMPIYLETHTAENVEVYKRLGFRLLESVDFHGYTHYAMKRPALKD